VLDLTDLAMRDPCWIDPGGRRATVSAGLSGGALEQAAGALGLRFGPDPSSLAWATVGGMIGTNAAGPRSYRLGAVDRWVEALELWTVDGPLRLRRGTPADPEHPAVARFRREAAPLLDRLEPAVRARWPATRKNTAGYGLHRYWAHRELIDLVIGSEGTLGVVTEAELALEPIPQARHTFRVALAERARLGPAIVALARAEPVAIELLDGSFLRLVESADTPGASWHGAGAVLLVDLEGDVAEDLAARARAARDALEGLAVEVHEATRPEEILALWSLRHRASPILAALGDRRRSLQVIEDGCVPPEQLAEYLAAVQAAADREQMAVVMFGHAGDGHVHVNLLADLHRRDWIDAVRRIHDTVLDVLCGLGGTPAGEHGAGRLRAPVLERVVGVEAMACFRAIKAAFDPAGLFNPGVILPDGSDPFGRLKVGEAATPLATGIAAALERLEATRGYGVSRWEP
jgi:FAD/FMN-containing dehydrogenase